MPLEPEYRPTFSPGQVAQYIISKSQLGHPDSSMPGWLSLGLRQVNAGVSSVQNPESPVSSPRFTGQQFLELLEREGTTTPVLAGVMANKDLAYALPGKVKLT